MGSFEEGKSMSTTILFRVWGLEVWCLGLRVGFGGFWV